MLKTPLAAASLIPHRSIVLIAVDVDGLRIVMAGDVDAICKATVGEVDETGAASSTVWILPDGAPFLHQGQQASAGAASARNKRIAAMGGRVRIMIYGLPPLVIGSTSIFSSSS